MQRRSRLLPLALAVLAVLAAAWLGYQFWRRAGEPLPGSGAVDLRLRRLEVQGWFRGKCVYWTLSNAVYPPASYLMLWPFVGWTGVTGARWLWAGFTVPILAALAIVVFRQGGPVGSRGRRLLAALLLASYPVGATVGNGQLGLVVLLGLIGSFTLLTTRAPSWRRDAAIAALFLVALVKPSLSAHFFWVLLLVRTGLRPAVLTLGGYTVLTWIASLVQEKGPLDLLRIWLRRGAAGVRYGASKGAGSIQLPDPPAEHVARALPEGTGDQLLRITSINLHSVLSAMGGADLQRTSSFAVLGLVGIWVWWRRRCPLWMLLGVTALVVRFASYHGWYDDVILLVPLVSLFRIAGGEGEGSGRLRRVAWTLACATALSLLAPGGLYTLPHPWNNVYVIAQTAVWLVVLVFLLYVANRTAPARHDAPLQSAT